jgi:hypothetical protein
MLLSRAVYCYGGLCVGKVGLSDKKGEFVLTLGYRDFLQLKTLNTKYENVKTSIDVLEAGVLF